MEEYKPKCILAPTPKLYRINARVQFLVSAVNDDHAAAVAHQTLDPIISTLITWPRVEGPTSAEENAQYTVTDINLRETEDAPGTDA